MWSLKGQQPEILTYGGRLRQHLIGAVEPLVGRVHVAFSDTLKAEQFRQFLEGLLARHENAGKILLVLDNARAHRSKELEPFLEANKDKLELFFLPPYCPDLNPMEWFWKFLRKQVSHDTFFDTFKKFQRALIKFIRNYKLSSLEIKSRCCFAKLL
jgi:putative transposase